MNETEALIILNNISGIGSIKIRFLIARFGSAKAVLQASSKEIAKFPGFGKKLADRIAEWQDNDFWRRDLELISRNHIDIVTYRDSRYPGRLLEIIDYPVVLYVRGSLRSVDQCCIAIIGTRRPTSYGMGMAQKFARGLASQGFTVVSGLARGIDTAAHRGALSSGRTIAVIGSGLARIYPKENRGLADKIGQQGAVLSEFPMNTSPDRQNFPRRNRIVSGLTMGTLLIEASLKGGAMITVSKALSQRREVFVLPGVIGSKNFHGNRWLIEKQMAQPVNSFRELIEKIKNSLS